MLPSARQLPSIYSFVFRFHLPPGPTRRVKGTRRALRRLASSTALVWVTQLVVGCSAPPEEETSEHALSEKAREAKKAKQAKKADVSSLDASPSSNEQEAGVSLSPVDGGPDADAPHETLDAGGETSVPGSTGTETQTATTSSSGQAPDPTSLADAGLPLEELDETEALPAAEPLPLGELVLHFDMEESDAWGFGADGGDVGTVMDQSSHGNDGVVHGNARQADEGKFGKAAYFDGSGWLQVSHHESLSGGSALTLSAWIRPDGFESGNDSYGIVSKRAAYNHQASYAIWLDGAGHLSSDIVQSDTRLRADEPVAPQEWTHVAAVFDGTLPEQRRLRLYINGTLVAEGAETSNTIPTDFDADLRVGDLPGGGHPFRGSIDEVAIWTCALRAEQIASLAEATIPPDACAEQHVAVLQE